MPQKRIAVIEDISCFGKCSATIALPILSAAGIETAVIPTAVFSTHTGGFSTPVKRDLSPDIVAIARHLKAEGISVGAVLTGYICSKEQIYLALEAASLISRKDTVFICDPAMGDGGRLYSGLPADFPAYMLKLCTAADIITPNITEAALMLGLEYKAPPYSEDYINLLIEGLRLKTGADIVLTGVSFDDRKIGSAVFDGESKTYIFADKQEGSYHGTGDLFTSVLAASYLNDRSLKAAAQIAANFTSLSIKKTIEDGTPERNGLNFEAQIPDLIKFLEL